MDLLHGLCERLREFFRCRLMIAVYLAAHRVIRDLAIDASIFGDHKGSLVFLNHQRAEVIVHAAHIASP